MTLFVVVILIALNLWTMLRLNQLRNVVFALIQFNAGLAENMKKDKNFSRDSEAYALPTVYKVWNMLEKRPIEKKWT